MRMAEEDVFNSGIYFGKIFHSRRQTARHAFSYDFGMMVLDLDELLALNDCSAWFSMNGLAPLSFRAGDYLSAEVQPNQRYCIASLQSRLRQKLTTLGASEQCDRFVFAGQIRHFGCYFSPVNFFFCYQQQLPRYLLAEVSNTPWNERHYYLVDLAQVQETEPSRVVDESDKVFHVSPFMDLNMKYLWRVSPPAEVLRVGIENHQQQQSVFNAQLSLTRQPFSSGSVTAMMRRFPFMTLKIVNGIYWHALRLFIKGVPFVGHPGGVKSNNTEAPEYTPSNK